MRDTIFVSHANPDDNRFTRWLALRLARDGYKVWSDVTGLLGGEDIWRDVERLIREDVVQFLYALSRASNQRTGTLQELQVALTVARIAAFTDFVIPLKIDDLPHGETNIQLARLFTTPFHDGWATGYSMLLEKLKRGGIPKNPDSSPGLVARWWGDRLSPDDGVIETPEEYLSNWFPITKMPHLIHLHELPGLPLGGAMPARLVGVWHGPYLVSFAPPQDMAAELGDSLPIRSTRTWPVATFLEKGASGIPRRQARDLVYRVLRTTWERFVESRGLPVYEMANKALCGYFTMKLVKEDRVSFKIGGGSGSRQLVGHRTRSRRLPAGGFEPVKQYWHFGVEARPLVYPRFAYALHAHVLFSDDGLNIWQSKTALHRTRRSACSDWWNDDWRDRLLATMAWLASGNSSITIEVGTGAALEIGCDSIRFQSPVSYVDPDESVANEEESRPGEDADEEVEE